MTVINLSGLQSLDLSDAIFNEYFEKSGHFAGSKFPEGTDVPVDVVWERDNPYQTEQEPALAVHLDNCCIGYIPVLSTVRGYISKAHKENNLADYQKHSERFKIVDFLRGHIENDIRQGIPVRGVLARVQVAPDNGKVLSVSVGFDYL